MGLSLAARIIPDRLIIMSSLLCVAVLHALTAPIMLSPKDIVSGADGWLYMCDVDDMIELGTRQIGILSLIIGVYYLQALSDQVCILNY